MPSTKFLTHKAWLGLLAFGLVLRLVIAPFPYGFMYDMDTFGQWGETLASHRWSEFYDIAPTPDHLPGDLYVHGLFANLFKAVGGSDFLGASYRYLLKLVPSVLDISVAAIISRLLTPKVGATRARAGSLLYVFNPAIIFMSAVWGQWDVLSGVLMLLAMFVIWRYPERWLWAIPILAWVVMIKPPLALQALVALLFVPLNQLRHNKKISEWSPRLIGQGAVAFIVGIGTMTAMMFPFQMGWVGSRQHTLLKQIEMAVDLYPFRTVGAANIWMLSPGMPVRELDDLAVFAGITSQQLGTGLFLIVLSLIALGAHWLWKLQCDTEAILVWAMASSNYAYFVLLTRSHERYVYPAILLLSILFIAKSSSRILQGSYILGSLAFLGNLVFVYWSAPFLTTTIFRTISLTHIVAFILLVAWPYQYTNHHNQAGVSRSRFLPADEAQTAHGSRPEA